MEDHNSPEAIAKRANQEDPIVMYLVVRESLNMSIGKTAVQCAHASQMLLLQDIELIKRFPTYSVSENTDITVRGQIFAEWLNSSFRKVTLKADDTEWRKVQEAFLEGVMRFTVIDAGLTEIPAGSETVMAIWPMHKSQRPKILQKLQALK